MWSAKRNFRCATVVNDSSQLGSDSSDKNVKKNAKPENKFRGKVEKTFKDEK